MLWRLSGWSPARVGLTAAGGFLVLALLVSLLLGPGDTFLYHRYAVRALAWPPFRHLPEEYPPLALVAFLLTLFPPNQWPELVFGAWMALLAAGAVVAFDLLHGRRAAFALFAYLVVGGLGTVTARYDLLPALAVVAAVHLTARRRPLPALALLGAGTLLKLYPAALVPVVMVAGYRQDLGWRRLAGALGAFGLVTAAGFGLAALLSPDGWLSPLRFGARRPPQVESLTATLLWAASQLGVPFWPDHSFHSLNVGSAWTGMVEAALSVVGLAAIAGTIWRQLLGRIDVFHAALAVVCVVILANKVFSPQYLIWALPLVAIGVGLNPGWVAVCVLTSLVYPALYAVYREQVWAPVPVISPLMLGVIAARNLLLVGLTARLVLGTTSMGREDEPAAPARYRRPARQAADLEVLAPDQAPGHDR